MTDKKSIDQDVKTDSSETMDVKPINPDDTDVVKTDNQTIPYSRFKEVNDELKDMKTKLSEFQSKEEKAKQKKLEEEGKYREIIADKDSVVNKLANENEALKGYQESRRETLLSLLPESDRDIYSGLELINLEKHVDKLKQKQSVTIDGSTPTREGQGDFGGYSSRTEYATKDPEGYAKWKADQTTLRYSAGVVRLPGQEPMIKN